MDILLPDKEGIRAQYAPVLNVVSSSRGTSDLAPFTTAKSKIGKRSTAVGEYLGEV